MDEYRKRILALRIAWMMNWNPDGAIGRRLVARVISSM